MDSVTNIASNTLYPIASADTPNRPSIQNHLKRKHAHTNLLSEDKDKRIKVVKHSELPLFCCVEKTDQTLMFNVSAGGMLETNGQFTGNEGGNEGVEDITNIDSTFQPQTAYPESLKNSGSWFNLSKTLKKLHSEEDKLLAADIYKNWMKDRGNDQSTIPVSFAQLLPLKLTSASGDGLYCDTATGGWFYLRGTADRDDCLNEVLMASLAAAAGQPVPKKGMLFEPSVDGMSYPKYWVVSAYVENLKVGEKSVKSASSEELARLYVIAAWLGNYQIFDDSYMGVGLDSTGRLHSLLWHAAGYYNREYCRKQRFDSDWGRGGFLGTVFELKDFFNVNEFHELSDFFQKLRESDIIAAMKALLVQPHGMIDNLVDLYGPAGEEEKRYLKFILYERLNFLAILYPKNLPRLTGGELGAIAVNGLAGVELTVTSPYIVDHRVIVGYRLNASGEKETQISFRLNQEKQQEFSRYLKEGISSTELQARLEYILTFCSQAQEKMSRILKKGVEETLLLAEQMLKAYEANEPCKGLRVDEFSSDCIPALKECITGLQHLQDLPIGEKFPTGKVFKIPQLPEFLSKRFYVDQTITFPRYEVKGHQWQVIDDETCGISYQGWRGCLLPKVPLSNFAMPEQPIEMEFHDCSAVAVNFEVFARKPLAGYSANHLQPDLRPESESESGGGVEHNGELLIDGIVRLTSQGQGHKTIMGMLDWMNGCGLETRRPDTDDWQKIYQQQIQRRFGQPSIGQSILSRLGLTSNPPLASNRKRDWSDFIRRYGRTTYLCPLGGGVQSDSGTTLHVKSLNLKEGKALLSALSGGLSLWSDTERYKLQCTPVTTEHPSKVGPVAMLFSEDARNEDIKHCFLELHPWVRDRIDFPMITVLKDASPRWWHMGEVPQAGPAIPCPPTRSFGEEFSFSEYLRHIHVADIATKNVLVALLKDHGFYIWPDGRTADELVTTSSMRLTQKALVKNPLLSKAQQQLIDKLDYASIRALLNQNPQIFANGELVKLDRVKIGSSGSDGTISGFDFTNVQITNSGLNNLTLKGCCFDKEFFQNNRLQNVRIEFSGVEVEQEALSSMLNVPISANAREVIIKRHSILII